MSYHVTFKYSTNRRFVAGDGVEVTVRRVNAQVDGHRRDSLIGSGDSVRLGLDLQPNLIKVHELTALTVQELGVF